jgi:5'(3')-deoxyribonucleotidase
MAAVTSDFILGVDLDGVCGDYAGALRQVVALERDVPVDSLPAQVSWDFGEWGLGPGDFEDLHRKAVLDHHVFRTMDLLPGAADALWRLSDAGVWIRIITHRLLGNWGHAVAVADTVTWLDTVGIPYRDLCFLGAKPQVEAQCYIDDATHNVEALRANGAHVIVFDQPYNRHLDGPRATDWTEAEELVGVRVADLGLALQPSLPGLQEEVPNRLHRRVNRP